MSLEADLKKEVFSKIISTYSIARSVVFNLEAMPLPIIRKLFNIDSSVIETAEFRDNLIEQIGQLYKKDSENIIDGLYPASVLKPGKVTTHIKTLVKVWVDAFFVSYRSSKKSHKKFNKSAKKYLLELPEYYQRNFHNQTDGYLTQESAEIYEHQVDLLFKGSTDAMRRSILPSLVKHFDREKPIRILELGAGVGSFTRFLKLTFPNSEIKAIDLSQPYLNKARKNLDNFSGVSCLQGDAEKLFFKDEYFDVVVSVFLFHELPYEVRKSVIRESKRVLKKGGYFGILDSIQKGDNPEMNQAIEEFPKIFHEPFYKNYLEKPLDQLVNEVFEVNATDSEVHFLSKCVYLQKSI